jgi:hypothetical protein
MKLLVMQLSPPSLLDKSNIAPKVMSDEYFVNPFLLLICMCILNVDARQRLD